PEAPRIPRVRDTLLGSSGYFYAVTTADELVPIPPLLEPDQPTEAGEPDEISASRRNLLDRVRQLRRVGKAQRPGNQEPLAGVCRLLDRIGRSIGTPSDIASSLRESARCLELALRDPVLRQAVKWPKDVLDGQGKRGSRAYRIDPLAKVSKERDLVRPY